MSDELLDDRIADLFARAKGLSAEDQSRFLDEECRHDPPEVRQRLEKLLAADRELRVTEDMRAPEPSRDTKPSRTIGPFKLLQRIGEGGMGEVWMAEQRHPVRRRVALKLVKSDSPTKEIIARFEAERQALAMMDHPNIAKVLDVGQTEGGQPYFVMELVQGVPITDYCDRNKLTPQERLTLFVPVCQAIQHAHLKGIIHRDIKPSNVLVTLYDGKPVAKVIDFGLAKALQTQTRLTDKTLFTEFGRVVGTLRYMSPEQAEMNALDVDTRTDVYSLGVMLYELLTGSTPLDEETVKRKALLSVLQLIREQEPPRPSKRLSDSGEAISGISEQRRIEPAQLSRILKGDLDWVVMKAIEKDRSRRYETAASLADDVQRYLLNEPLQARPPSFRYRFGKMARKYRAAVFAAAAVLASLVIGIIVTGALASWAVSEKARAQAALGEKEKALNAADTARKEAEAAQIRTMDALRSATDDVVENLITSKGTMGPTERAYLQSALKRWQAIADEHGDSLMAQSMRSEGAFNVAWLQMTLGEREAAVINYREAIKINRRLVEQLPAVPEYHVDLAESYCGLGILLRDTGEPNGSLEFFDIAVQILKAVNDRAPRDVTAKECLRNIYEDRALAYDLLRNHVEAAKDWDRAIGLSAPAGQLSVRALRAVSHARAGMVTEAVAEASELTRHPNCGPDDWYDFACIYTVASTKVPSKQQEYADRAMELLRKSVETGYQDAEYLKNDADLAALREREDFQSLIAELEAVVGTSR